MASGCIEPALMASSSRSCFSNLAQDGLAVSAILYCTYERAYSDITLPSAGA